MNALRKIDHSVYDFACTIHTLVDSGKSVDSRAFWQQIDKIIYE